MTVEQGPRAQAPVVVGSVQTQPPAVVTAQVQAGAQTWTGPVQAQAPVLVPGPVQAAEPLVTGWQAPQAPPGDIAGIDDIADVDAPPDVAGLLERQATQRVAPVTRDDVLAPHVNSLTPHPAYDDQPSLRLLFENGLV